jgi:outer membrane protein TolC
MSLGRALRAPVVGAVLVLAGCSSYHELPLSQRGNLVSSLNQLDLTLPAAESGKTPVMLDATKPLTPQQVALLAVVNDPDLADQRGKIDSAKADLLEAQILPNPSVSLDYLFLLGGPGTSPAQGGANGWDASISQDIRSIVTYGRHVDAAKARYKQVSADALWDVWQVAQKARLLAIDINADSREIAYREQELALLTDELKGVRAATAAGNLDLTALAPLLAAEAGSEHDLAAARVTMLKDWQDLDALLGLQPTARFAIAAPEPVKLPSEIDSLIASLPGRRPDLVALKLGYDAADEDVRAAILGQFPAFSLGVMGGSDTTSVSSIGPQVTFDLPIFDRNQAKIASTQATRLQLHAEYQARLDEAEGTARGLLARARVAESNLERARAAAQSAEQISQSAQRAYHQGNLSQRDVTDFETTALDRQLDALDYERDLEENSLALSVELGIGFPNTMTNTPYHAHSSPQETRL